MHAINMIRNRSRLLFSLLIVVILGVSGVSLLRSLAPRSKSDSVTATQDASVVQTNTVLKRISNNSEDRAPDKNESKSTDARMAFTDPSLSVGKRFNELAEMAERGDLNAKHFALQIANDCAALSKVPDDQPALGQTKATPYQIQLHGQMKAACAEVIADPAFPKFEKIIGAHPVDVYDGTMKLTIRQQFANRGPDAAIDAVVSAISQRPDDATVDMTADELANLDISSIYLQPALSSVDSVNPRQRNQLMRFALNLLACSYGRPCGPNSFVVQSTCTALGACVPGADLQGVYQAQLLSGQQMADVLSLLAYLQQVQPTFTWK